MPRIPHRCRDCCRFLQPDGSRCPDSQGLDQPASSKCRFKAGRPRWPRFQGRAVREQKFDPEQPAAWAFWTSNQQCLLLTWDLDHNQYGHFSCFLVGMDDQGIETKPYTPQRPRPTFCGEVVVQGVGENDLWRSFGYQDQDNVDPEGNVVNKPRAVLLYPKRED